MEWQVFNAMDPSRRHSWSSKGTGDEEADSVKLASRRVARGKVTDMDSD